MTKIVHNVNQATLLSPNLQSKDKSDYAGIDELWTNEKFLKNYNKDVVNKLSEFSREKPDVLEFGAGIGTLAQLWQSTTMVKPKCL